MVNRALTSGLLCYGGRNAAGGPAVDDVLDDRRHSPSQIGAKASRATGSRSPFVRLRELIDRFPPGQSAISLAVGEPQHPIPPFVGSIIAAHVNEFGRYPANKGLDEFGVAVAGWLGRRYDAGAPGRSGERSAGAQRHPRGTFPRRARRQELGDAARGPAGRAHSQSVLCGLRGRRDRRRLRAGLSADHARDRLPARPRCARR